MKLTQFHAPGNLTDFDGQMAKDLSKQVSDTIDGEVTSLVQNNHGIKPQFYNPARLDVGEGVLPRR